jgi:hypothetical protein
MRTEAKPAVVTQGTVVQCYGCGWKDYLGNAAQSVWLDHRPGHLISAEQGGNGKNYRCPKCKELIFYVRYDRNRQIIAPKGYQYKNVV